MQRVVPAVILAVAVAIVFAIPDIGGIATWKIALAALGLVLFVLGGRSPQPR
jgi:membrane-bound ClpP family serine protease